VATSGVTYSKESDYGGAKVLMGQEVVRLNVMGQVCVASVPCCMVCCRRISGTLTCSACGRGCCVVVVILQPHPQSFKTVSAAIGSHPGHMEVKLEFQRC
jgi:hypothetical protein